jgi:hypothetical protein
VFIRHVNPSFVGVALRLQLDVADHLLDCAFPLNERWAMV